MGKPAARVGDMHTCPMATPGTPPIPHVGGPITGPGVPNVLIGGMPAATMGDMATCVGPPDSIVLGSTGVMIGGKPAARMGDMTAHGGVIAVGLPTVLIGEVGVAVVSPLGVTPGHPPGTVQGGPPEGASATGAKSGANAGEPQHWVEIELVDEEGEPVIGEHYRIELPDGSVVEGVTDGKGRALHKGQWSGSCKITFPELDRDGWAPTS